MGVSVLTQHNDNQRTGLNLQEPGLTVDNVRNKFRRLTQLEVDPPAEGGPTGWSSQIVAQPLLASGVAFGGATIKDVLIVATMHGTVYAFDATHNGNPNHTYPRLWAVWLGQIGPGQVVPPVQDIPGPPWTDQKDGWNTNPEWGILSTPVIDAGRKKVYVVMWNADNGGTYRLHALDLTDGSHKAGPQIIQGAAGAHGEIHFDPVFQKQRPGLLLVRPEDVPPDRRAALGPDGALYIGFGASAEGMMIGGKPTYYGWVFAFDARTLQNRGRPWCATPQGRRGGIWQAGQGLVATPDGDVILMTGDGPFDEHLNDFGQSIVKLSGPDLRLLTFFTPADWKNQVAQDQDLGSAGPLYIADGPFVVGGGKTGVLYCVNPANMGKLGNPIDQFEATADPPEWKIHPPPADWDLDHHIHGSPVYYPPLRRLYLWGENDVLRALTLNPHGEFSSANPAVGDVVGPSGMPGGMLSLTADGDKHPLVWALMPAPAPFDPINRWKADANRTRLVKGVLRAFDATTLKEIWNSDGPGGGFPWHFAKFSPPTVVNGRAYVPTYDGQLVIFGLA